MEQKIGNKRGREGGGEGGRGGGGKPDIERGRTFDGKRCKADRGYVMDFLETQLDELEMRALVGRIKDEASGEGGGAAPDRGVTQRAKQEMKALADIFKSVTGRVGQSAGGGSRGGSSS